MHITIAIASWNRARLLRQTLASLGGLRWPAGVTGEILVCDNNSTDDTRQVVAEAASLVPAPAGVPVRYLFEKQQGKSYALNQMIAAARGEWMLFLDDDVKVEPKLIESYVQGIAAYPQAVCLGGPIEPWLEGDITAGQRWLLERFPACFGVQQVERDLPMQPPTVSAWGANMLLRRDAIPVEGFATGRGMIGGQRIAGEDVGMIATLLASPTAQGWMLARAKVFHYTPATSLHWRRVWQWQKGIGRQWILSRGAPAPGKFGIPWWAWREMGKRSFALLLAWRPKPTPAYADAFTAAAQWWGYMGY